MGGKTGLGVPLLLSMCLAAVAGGEGSAEAQEPGDFLRDLAGEWSVVSEARLGPGADPIRSEGRETARMVGQWLVAEGSTRTPDGRPVTSIFTLGPDASGQGFIGTWIDSMQSHMWRYSGSLDAAGRTLILETEGPIFGDPSRLGRYREVIEVPEPGRKVIRSLILGPDGEWFEFSRAEYTRAGS